MLFVEQRYGRGQIELAPERGIRTADVVERFAVAHQNAQSSLTCGGRDFYRNLLHNALAAIGREHGFEHNLFPRTSFRHTGSSALQAGPAAFADEVEIQLHARNGRGAIGIVVDAAEALAQGNCSLHCRGLRILRRREHVAHRDLGKSFHTDAARETVCNLLAELVDTV